ncbi:Kinetochore-associated protein KNL-2 homolog [Linum perenne]
MAASPVSDHTPIGAVDRRNTSNSDASSYFQKTVTLQEWWLIKTDDDYKGKRLGVAGIASSDQRGRREFHSAPVIKRYDMFTLETADAVTLYINGFINRTRTLENGFPTEIFDHFLMGFPLYWELCGKRWCEVPANSEADQEKTSADPTHEINDLESTAAVSTPIANKQSSDVEVVEDGHHIQSENLDVTKPSKSSMLHSSVANYTSSACEEVNVENYSIPQGTLEPSEHENGGHTSFPTDAEFCEDVCHDGLMESPSAPNFHKPSTSSLPDVVADSGASAGYNVDSPGRIESLEINTRSKKRPIRKSNRKVAHVHGVAALNHCSPGEVIGNGRDNVVHMNESKSNQKTASKSKVKRSQKLASESIKLLDEGKLDGTVHQNPSVSAINERDSAGHLTVSKSDQKTASGSTMKRKKKLPSKSTMTHDEGKVDGRDNVVHLNESKSNHKTASKSKVKRNKKLASESIKLLDEGKLDGTVHQNPPVLAINERDSAGHLTVSKFDQKTASGCTLKQKKKLPSESTMANDEGILDGTVHQNPPVWKINERDNMGHLNVSKSDQKTASGSTMKRKKKLPSKSTMTHDEGKVDGTVHQSPPLLRKVRHRRSRVEKPRKRSKTSETANRIKVTNGGSGVKKAKKRIHFETPASPSTVEAKASSCLRSPESLNLKRSRSGRLLMPTLDFWRNETPVYDGERKVIGILGQLDIVQPSRGSRSEPVKKPKTK